MDVGLRLVRDVEVDESVDLLDVDAARGRQ
jgi:hypothetical protein